jgi:hypothetical protein
MLRWGESIVPLIEKSLGQKFAEMGGQFQKSYQETDAEKLVNRNMIKNSWLIFFNQAL